MTVFLSGGAKNGKTALAEDIAVKLAGEGKRFYVATMIPSDGEDRSRIARHREERAGKGFGTLEVGRDIASCVGMGGADAVRAVLEDQAVLRVEAQFGGSRFKDLRIRLGLLNLSPAHAGGQVRPDAGLIPV